MKIDINLRTLTQSWSHQTSAHTQICRQTERERERERETHTHTHRQRHRQTDRQTGALTCRLISWASHTCLCHTLDPSGIRMISDVEALEVQQIVLLIHLIQLQTHLYLPHTHIDHTCRQTDQSTYTYTHWQTNTQTHTEDSLIYTTCCFPTDGCHIN